MIPRIIPALLLATALLSAANSATAADAPEATVSSVGVATVEKQPQFLRMTTELQVEGATLKDALAKLKTRREEIKASLTKLGALEAAIDLGDAKVADAGGGDRRDAIARAMRQRMAASKPAGGAAPAPAKPVSVSATIRADWALKGDSGEALLLVASDLQDKIKDAKLFDAPKSAAKAEEEEEGQTDSFSGNDQGPKPGEPVFFYVAKISEAEQAKASAEAFAKSKEAASRLAKAAGATLGALRTLTSQGNDMSAASDDYGYNRYNSYMQRYMSQMSRQLPDASGETESLSPQPGKITHQVFVSTTFMIK